MTNEFLNYLNKSVDKYGDDITIVVYSNDKAESNGIKELLKGQLFTKRAMFPYMGMDNAPAGFHNECLIIILSFTLTSHETWPRIIQAMINNCTMEKSEIHIMGFDKSIIKQQ